MKESADQARVEVRQARRRFKALDISTAMATTAAPKTEAQPEKRKKESILDLSRFLEKSVRIKFNGGRECSGTLKGYDPLLNMVLDNTIEYLRDPDDPYKLTDDTRQLGLVVCRGTTVTLICPTDGMEAIANPFVQE